MRTETTTRHDLIRAALEALSMLNSPEDIAETLELFGEDAGRVGNELAHAHQSTLPAKTWGAVARACDTAARTIRTKVKRAEG